MHSQPKLDPQHPGNAGGWTGIKVLVTGAGGFIGSHLCEELVEAGAEVTGMIRYSSRSGNDWGNLEFLDEEKRSEIRVVAGNIEDPFYVESQVRGKEVVFHLAALIAIPYSYVAPLSYVRTNIDGTVNVLEAARKSGHTRVVHTSTSETYGSALYTPIDEKHPLQGQSPYSASKIGADKMAESYSRSFETPVTTVRPFNTFGPRQSARAVIPTIISQALEEPKIRLGSQSPIRDLTYVRDTVEGFLRIGASESAIGETINIGQGKGISIGDLAAKILGIMGCDKPVVTDETRIRPADSEVLQLLCDNTRARELVGWSPRHSLEDGLRQTIEFISGNRDLFRAAQYTV